MKLGHVGDLGRLEAFESRNPLDDGPRGRAGRGDHRVRPQITAQGIAHTRGCAVTIESALRTAAQCHMGVSGVIPPFNRALATSVR